MTRPRALLLSDLPMPPQHRKLLRALAWSYPAPLSINQAIERIWPDDNEPEWTTNTIRAYVHFLRAQGWGIVTRCGVGYVLTQAAFDRLTLPVPHKERAR